jgi:hypothetical protein
VGAYPALALGAAFTSSSTATSSELLDWSINYTEDQSAIANVDFTFTSTKVIGTNLDSSPVFKYSSAFTTNGSGVSALTGLEWGVYTVVVTDPSYDIAEACEDVPYVLAPGVSENLIFSLVLNVPYSQRVTVVDSLGVSIPSATVRLQRSGFDETKTTSACGQVFFGTGLGNNADYELDVSATGYTAQNINPIEITGDGVLIVTLSDI